MAGGQKKVCPALSPKARRYVHGTRTAIALRVQHGEAQLVDDNAPVTDPAQNEQATLEGEQQRNDSGQAQAAPGHMCLVHVAPLRFRQVVVAAVAVRQVPLADCRLVPENPPGLGRRRQEVAEGLRVLRDYEHCQVPHEVLGRRQASHGLNILLDGGQLSFGHLLPLVTPTDVDGDHVRRGPGRAEHSEVRLGRQPHNGRRQVPEHICQGCQPFLGLIGLQRARILHEHRVPWGLLPVVVVRLDDGGERAARLWPKVAREARARVPAELPVRPQPVLAPHQRGIEVGGPA
mmetsp:Transcript_119380/g.207831  ORF Transcript_119380/g.207831 Transcript_119380/m.207831 type:complete len:290 (+) Transcript_119380:466-1335(+)